MRIRPLTELPVAARNFLVRRQPKSDNTHVQVAGRHVNRDYGLSFDIPHTDELGGFLQSLAQAEFGGTVPSLAGTGVPYMVGTIRQVGGAVLITFSGENAPYFAMPYSDGSSVEFEVVDPDPELIAAL